MFLKIHNWITRPSNGTATVIELPEPYRGILRIIGYIILIVGWFFIISTIVKSIKKK